jgi:hypothetical protein
MRARRRFGNRDDDRFAGPRVFFHIAHAAHLDRQQSARQWRAASEPRSLPDDLCGQVHTRHEHARPGASNRADDMGGGENQALSQIYAASGSPRLWRVLPDVDRVHAQGVVRRLSVGKPERC